VNKPLVSIIINCYNGEKYLRNTLESVFEQTYNNWEIIFWDNQSTDDSRRIFFEYASDPRLRYFYASKHTLLYKARNLALSRAKGELIAFLDTDDWWLPDKLEKQVPLFSNPEIGMVCSNYYIFQERYIKSTIAHKFSLPMGWVINELLCNYYVGLLTLMVRRDIFQERDCYFNDRYHIIGDFDCVIRLSREVKLACLQEPLAYYRVHEHNESKKKRYLHIDELNNWISEVEISHPDVAMLSGFLKQKELLNYFRGLNAALEGKKIEAFKFLLKLPYSRAKLKLIVSILSPRWLIDHFKL
jgi:glycosyltransferase involved in cell wall biosynthesis